ncbi:hypothetical protein F5B21DRAFT_469532 [Xylaria acuta]|nr:hypothetical protein F5B21DRAFT_469532 [Xylaria acuta]
MYPWARRLLGAGSLNLLASKAISHCPAKLLTSTRSDTFMNTAACLRMLIMDYLNGPNAAAYLLKHRCLTEVW